MKTSVISIKTNSLLLAFALCLLAITLQAQNEQKGFSFQGYARDFNGAAYSSSNITAQFSIYPEGESVEYMEQQALTTDPYGVFHAVVGSETPVDFSAVDFSKKKYFIKAEVKVAGGDFVEIADTELLAVPYAKAAERAANGNPPGVVQSFAGASAPAGYLVCDGSTVPTATYPELYAAIGNAWGGDATNFNLPDLRGQFLRGQDMGEGIDPEAASRTASNAGGNTGDQVGTIQADVLAIHNHFSGQSIQGSLQGGNEFYLQISPAVVPNAYTSSVGGTETRPKNAAVLFIIKY